LIGAQLPGQRAAYWYFFEDFVGSVYLRGNDYQTELTIIKNGDESMINKRFVAIVLAVGLLLSIGCVESQRHMGQQTPPPYHPGLPHGTHGEPEQVKEISTSIDGYGVKQYSDVAQIE